MSTRSTIHFKDEYGETIIYRHSDGYVAVGGADLLDFIDRYTKGRGAAHMDRSYAAAHFVVFLAKMFQRGDDPLDFLSVGIDDRDPGDIEYRYTVMCDASGTVYVEERDFDVVHPWDNVAFKGRRELTWEEVNREQAEMERRIAEHRKQHPALYVVEAE